MTKSSISKQTRYYFFIAAFILVLSAKVGQLVQTDPDYRVRMNASSVDLFATYPPRGWIYDRAQVPLAWNVPTYDIMVTFNALNSEMDTLKFCQLLSITKSEFERRINKNWRDIRYSKSVPFVFMRHVSAKECADFQEFLHEFPGFSIFRRNVEREYFPVAANILGYIKEIDWEEAGALGLDYIAGDFAGVKGLELFYEEILHPKKGGQYFLLDDSGEKTISHKNGAQDFVGRPGKHLFTTIDAKLQQYIEDLLKEKTGGIMAIEPSTGEILAMVNAPSYNPNIFGSLQKRTEIQNEVNRDTSGLLWNRTLKARFSPSELFLPAVALAALQSGTLTPDRSIPCDGFYYLNGEPITKCYKHPTCTSLQQAIEFSCQTYFTTVFVELIEHFGMDYPGRGLDSFNVYVEQLGFGQPTGVDLYGEERGYYPTSDYYDRWFGMQGIRSKKWPAIWIRNLGVGQGELLTTTAQLAQFASIIANRGYYIPPHLVHQVTDESGNATSPNKEYLSRKSVRINPNHFDSVIKGLKAASAKASSYSGIPWCGLSGSALSSYGNDHSVFLGFAPVEQPQIAIAIFLENTLPGSKIAQDVGEQIISRYLGEEGPRNDRSEHGTNKTITSTHNPPKMKSISSKLIDNSLANNERLLLIDKGTLDSIYIGMGVISSEGVIGVVKSTSLQNSRILPIVHEQTRLSARIQKSNFFGVLTWDGKSPRYMQLEDVTLQANAKIGDTIYTSGLSSIFPSALPIGKVDQIDLLEEDGFYLMQIKLFEDIQQIRDVQVVSKFGSELLELGLE